VQSFIPTRPYNLRADATALGGRLRQPVDEFIETIAPVSLPAVGGFALARSEGFTHKDIVSFSRAYTRVSSHKRDDGSASILITAVVENLNILEVFSARRIVSQLTISIPSSHGPIQVSPLGSEFDGLRVTGYDCIPTLKTGLLRPERLPEEPTPNERAPEGRSSQSLTWPEVFEAGRTQAQSLLSVFKGRNESDAYAWAEKRHGWMTAAPPSSRTALVSLIDELKTDAPVRCSGHILEIPDFGRFYLGEWYIGHETTQLVGVRAELGCAIGGQITAACGGGGGLGDT
jgi:hypothetical protein